MPYWAAARNGRFMLPRCRQCGLCCHPSRTRCVRCSSPELSYQPADGKGLVYSFTVVWRALIPALAPLVPYVLALIDLTEGPRLVSVVRCEPGEARVGLPVAVTFEPITPDLVLPIFIPRAELLVVGSADGGVQGE
jgi:uncharacterized OB-fold protein